MITTKQNTLIDLKLLDLRDRFHPSASLGLRAEAYRQENSWTHKEKLFWLNLELFVPIDGEKIVAYNYDQFGIISNVKWRGQGI